MEKQKKQYSLFTSVAMIVGIVIGSGIFFKADNILIATSGNVGLGIVIFCIAAFSIIFGSLTISQFAELTDNPGGIITYAEEFIHKRFACAVGWFQGFVYYPSLAVVVSWVVGVYVGVLFGWDLSLAGQIGIGMAWFSLCFLYNTLSARLGGWFQEASTVIKLIPLFLLAIAGLILGDPMNAIMNPTPEAVEATKTLAWMSAIGPIAFSFDGWIISTSVAHEVKDATKNMPKALVMSPLFILAAYLMYFIGICATVGPEQVMSLGDESVTLAASSLFGPAFAGTFTVFVIISVMGTANGIILGFIRIPYSLALRNMMPFSGKIQKLDPKSKMPVNSAIVGFGFGLFWWLIHFLSQKYGWLPNTDISEISIAVNYLMYIALYYAMFRLWRKGVVKKVSKGLVYPLLATIGSLFILYGSAQNPSFPVFAGVCLLSLLAGFLYGSRAKELKELQGLDLN